jgi:hypothetical protein
VGGKKRKRQQQQKKQKRDSPSMVGSYSSTKWLWMSWMVKHDFPTPPPPTTTSLYSRRNLEAIVWSGRQAVWAEREEGWAERRRAGQGSRGEGGQRAGVDARCEVRGARWQGVRVRVRAWGGEQQRWRRGRTGKAASRARAGPAGSEQRAAAAVWL